MVYGGKSLLKLSQNKKDLNDVTATPFSVLLCCWQLRKRHRDDFSKTRVKFRIILVYVSSSFIFSYGLAYLFLRPCTAIISEMRHCMSNITFAHLPSKVIQSCTFPQQWHHIGFYSSLGSPQYLF